MNFSLMASKKLIFSYTARNTFPNMHAMSPFKLPREQHLMRPWLSLADIDILKSCLCMDTNKINVGYRPARHPWLIWQTSFASNQFLLPLGQIGHAYVGATLLSFISSVPSW